MKDRTLLMIPGPIEFEPAVLQALGAPTASHVAPDFIEAFGQALERMRDVWLCPSGQPFIVAGSGTLAMDIPAANLIEPGDKCRHYDKCRNWKYNVCNGKGCPFKNDGTYDKDFNCSIARAYDIVGDSDEKESI